MAPFKMIAYMQAYCESVDLQRIPGCRNEDAAWNCAICVAS